MHPSAMSLLFLLVSCVAGTPLSSSTFIPTRLVNVTWDNDNWRLSTTYADSGHYQGRASLANGYIGISVAALGPFFEVDEPVNGDNIQGWPIFDRRQAFSTVAGFYDEQANTSGTNYDWLNVLGGESLISGIPHWSNLLIEAEGYTLNATIDHAQISNFSSMLDYRSAVLSWKYSWTPPSANTIHVEYSMFLHKVFVNQAVVQLRMTTDSKSSSITVYDVLEGDGTVRTDFIAKESGKEPGTIWTAVSPTNIPNITAYIYSTLRSNANARVSCMSTSGGNQSTISQSLKISRLIPGEEVVISKYVGIASGDAFGNPQIVAHHASFEGAQTGYAQMLASHVAEWKNIMPSDSIDNYTVPSKGLPNDPNIIESQILAVTNPFYLLQNTISEAAVVAAGNNSELGVNSIAVCGLSSACYAGMIFWDVEVWMAPGLAVTFPYAARQISEYRRAKYTQALANVKEAYTSSQAGRTFSNESAIFPWTSGRFGNCTGTGPCFDYEYHINGDIALQLKNYYIVTGDSATFQASYQPIYDSISQVYSDLLLYNDTLAAYTLLNATDPDEYANNVDNPGYTMILIRTQLESSNQLRERFDQPTNTQWETQAANAYIPANANAGIVLEYTGMNGSITVKQADVVLVDDLLDYENPDTLADLDYYASKQTQNGPGMTYAVFSVDASEAAPAGCSAFTYDLYSSQPYVRAPWFQFSEQLNDDYTTNGGTHPAFPFLTGMGGANRVAVFGYLGLRLQTDTLNINPSLPPQIEHLDYRTIYWQGHAINATSNQTHTTVQRLPKALANANSTFYQAPIPVTIGFNAQTYNLSLNATLTFPNRQVGHIKTIPGNIAQCQPAISLQPYVPGQFPLAAVDGAVSTLWQPLNASLPATLNVTLGTSGIQPIKGFAFDWAQSPPESFSISFSNSSTSAQEVEAYSTSNVTISMPYNATLNAMVTPYMSNTTNITLETIVYGGVYAYLTVRGNQAGSGSGGQGATVAEWAIVAEGEEAEMKRFYGGGEV